MSDGKRWWLIGAPDQYMTDTIIDDYSTEDEALVVARSYCKGWYYIIHGVVMADHDERGKPQTY